jgi:hypothetical protein
MSTKSEASLVAMRSSSSSSGSCKNEKITFELVDILPIQDVEIANTSRDDELAKLPPADGGKGAWMFLAGCFVFEALVWGKRFLVLQQSTVD